ncbi:MAG: hypothetical protein KC550_00555 [Nanoarchaeota archaeon]|nr:hypothetical protein [Nanoarchaeota archaeon]
MKKTILTLLLATFIIFAGCSQTEANSIQVLNNNETENNNQTKNEVKEQTPTIDSFQECVDAGNPTTRSIPAQCSANGKTFIEELSNQFKCENAQGTWLEEYNECEYISQELCQEMKGTFNECESACRNDPNAQMCTMQCVAVCNFN